MTAPTLKYRFLLINAFSLAPGNDFQMRSFTGPKETQLYNYQDVKPFLEGIDWDLHPGAPTTHGNFPVATKEAFMSVGNNRLPLVPVHVLRTSLTYAHPAGFSITPSVDIVPQGAFVDYANTFRVPGYALFNIGASAKLPNGGEAFVDVRNIADKRYIADFGPVVLYNAATTSSFYPGTGRSIYGGVRVKF